MRLIGATINQRGLLRMRATKVGADTVLASIIRMVEQAQGSKAPIQRLADTISSIFVPVVLVIAALTFIGWAIIGNVTAAPLSASSMTACQQPLDRCHCGRGCRAGGSLPLRFGTGNADRYHGWHGQRR